MPINLHPEDKNKIRENLTSLMEDAPIKNRDFAKKWKPMFPSLKLNLQFMPTKVITAIMLVALLFGTGATALAAEGSLPGDSLYPVQQATETLRGWMKFSPELKAEWHAKMAEKRLEELDRLVEEEKITEEQKELLEQKVEARIAKADEQFEKMKSRGQEGKALGIISKIETSLMAREHIFARAGKAFEKLAEHDQALAEKFEQKAELMIEKREAIEQRIKNANGEKMKEASEGKMQAAQNKIEEVERFIEENKERLEEENVEKALEKLQEAKDAHQQGKEKYDEEKYGEAFVAFTKAHRLAQHAKIIAMGKEIMPAVISKPILQKIKPFGILKKVSAPNPDIDEADDEDSGDDEDKNE